MNNQLTTDFDFAAWRERIGLHIKGKKLTQQEAADMLGVSRFQVGRWEDNDPTPDRRTVMACLWLEEHAERSE